MLVHIQRLTVPGLLLFFSMVANADTKDQALSDCNASITPFQSNQGYICMDDSDDSRFLKTRDDGKTFLQTYYYDDPTQDPEECYENGQIYDSQTQSCVLDCPEGELNGVCLQPPAANDNTCNSESDDYQGFIGNGNTKHNICESDMQCDGGSAGLVNGVMACIPDEYGPPSCPSGATVVIDEYGFVCESNNDSPEPDEEPNTDTDGDGEPDEYQEENDPLANTKATEKLNDSVDQGVAETKKGNQRLDRINSTISQGNSTLEDISGSVGALKDGMQVPEGGFNPDGFGGRIPTFSETSESFVNTVMGVPAVALAAGMGDMPETELCPTWTIPQTPVSGPLVMDIHCGIVNEYRGVISALFMFFWSASALLLFLRA